MSSKTFYSFCLVLSLCIVSFGCKEETSSSPTPPQKSSSSPIPSGNIGEAEISVKVDGITLGQAVMVATMADQNYKIDTATIQSDGTFKFTRQEGYPPGAFFVVLPNNSNFQFLLDKDQTLTLETKFGDLVNSMKVSGSLDNELLYESLVYEQKSAPELSSLVSQMQGLDPESEQYKSLRAKQNEITKNNRNFLQSLFDKNPNTLFTAFKKAGQNPELKIMYDANGKEDRAAQVQKYREEFWDGVDFNDQRLIRTPVIYNKLNRYITELTAQQPDSLKKSIATVIDMAPPSSEIFKFFVNWIALKYEPTKTTLMDSEAIYVFMVQNYINKEKAFWAEDAQIQGLQQRASEMANSLIGQKGPDVDAPSINGGSASIYDIKAPYIIVYLYNPDCDHCQEETPKLVQFYREWKPRGLEVYAIAIDTEDAPWKDFVSKNRMDFINVHDPTNRSIYAKYYVDNTPEVYVLNPERTIIGKNLKINQIATIINRDMQNR